MSGHQRWADIKRKSEETNMFSEAEKLRDRLREVSVKGDWVTPMTRNEAARAADVVDFLLNEINDQAHLYLGDAIDNGIEGGIIVLDSERVVVWDVVPLQTVKE